MPFDPAIHHRRSIRLPGYDYTQAGAYFVTICTHQRECLFGSVEDGEMCLNPLGEAVAFTWNDLVNHVAGIVLGPFVIMPNHLHGIIVITRRGEASAGLNQRMFNTPTADASPQPPKGTRSGSIGAMAQNFKSVSTRKINALRASPGLPVWQRDYYEHIVRGDDELNRICAYILDNPRRWGEDAENPIRGQ